MKISFTTRPQITKNYLLSKYSEETYMSYYLGLPIKKGLFKNPLRKDRKVTCSFYRNKSGELVFHDFATGQHLTFIGVVMEKYNINYGQALKCIAKDFNLISSDKNYTAVIKDSPKFVSNGPAKIGVEIKDFTKEELNWWKSYGITPDLLKKYHVYSCKNIFLNDNLFTTGNRLTFGYYGGKINGHELWRIYYSQKKEYRFLTNWPSKKIQGFEQLPDKGKLLVITKSMKDVMCLASLGITAIAPNSENIFISNNVLEDLKRRFKYIIVLYDNDSAGISNMKKIKRKYPDLIYFWIPRKYEAKDISDFYKKYGRYDTFKFIESNLIKLKNYSQ